MSQRNKTLAGVAPSSPVIFSAVETVREDEETVIQIEGYDFDEAQRERVGDANMTT